METKPLRIDVDSVIRQRLPRHYRYIPKWLIRWIERTIHQDGLNKILQDMGDKKGVEAADIALRDLNVKYQAVGEDNIPNEGRFIFASNHPLGGVDGVALGSVIGRHYDGRFRYLVNDILMNLPGLAPVCIPINKTGKQSRDFPAMVEAGFQSDNHMLMFPAGICSRKINGQVHDIPWKKTFITKSVQYQRDIVPIHFGGQNSEFFYKLANFSDKYVKKVNIAMLFLVDEMYKNVHKTFRVAIGKPIPWQTFDKSKTPMEWAKFVEDSVYQL